METIGQRISRLRAIADVSSRELSTLVGLSHGTLGALERGEVRDMKTAVASKLAETLGVDLDWLINGEGPEPTAKRVAAAVERARTESAA